ncbi:MAG: glycosyl hydrolase, partial [Cellulomonadaceae bacterium]|nr:glycosyl hydrolase [Cellulomonadaceae bacterium]
MPGPDGAWGQALVDAVRAGEVDEKDIDRKVRRILRLAVRVGALDGFERVEPAGASDAQTLLALTRQAARDGMVLLANDGTLPLGRPRTVAVIGEGARFARVQGGGSATVIPEFVVSPLDGLRERFPDAEITWSLGSVVQQGLAPLPVGTFCTPEGDPGLLVRYLDPDGVETGREVRTSSWLVWFNGESQAGAADVVEFSFTYTPEVSADSFDLGVGGLADVEVLVDGDRVGAAEVRTKPGDDPATVVLNPPFTSVVVPSPTGSANVVVRFRPVAGGMPDALALRVGSTPDASDADELIAAAVAQAAAADVAIVVVSTSNEVESEGFDRVTLALPGTQDELVRAVARACSRTVVVVNSGAPVTLPWRTEVSAVLATWFPGQEFGHALADVLSGDVEPGGRLPVSWPAAESDVPVRDVTPTDGRLDYSEGIHIGYRAWDKVGGRPAFPFGHGLGYTSWGLDALSVAPWTERGTSATVAVTNAGDRTGKFVVQLYAERDSSSGVERPRRWLVGFEAGHLAPGARTTATIPLPWRRFAHWADGSWAVEPGAFRLVAALSCAHDGPSSVILVGERGSAQ